MHQQGTMRRPDPLQELPLEPFLHPTPASAKPIRTKRPHSPGCPTPFSPAKRRILKEEGIFSLEQTCKSPLPSLKGSPARFNHVVAGPASPARVLDFGLPKTYGGDPQKRVASHELEFDAIPSLVSSSSTNQLAPSPELKARNARSTRRPDLTESIQHVTNPYDFSSSDSSSRARFTSVPTFTPRESPPQPLPHSVHYPGFVVYQDPYTITYSIEDSNKSSLDMDVDNDPCKENLPPPRKIRKGATVGSGSISKAEGSTLKKEHSTNETPGRRTAWSGANPSTPPSSKFNRMKDRLSLSGTPQNSKKFLQQLMKDELDLGEGQEESDE